MISRDELYDCLRAYLAALKSRDTAAVRWAEDVRVTENNVALAPGDGLWGTISGLGAYQLLFADVSTRQVGLFGCVEETVETSAFTVRLALDESGAVCEAETLVARQSDEGIRFDNPRFYDKPVMNAFVAAADRTRREEMWRLANGYFDTMQKNDGTLHTRFHPECDRVENGVQTTRTDNAEFAAKVPVAKLGCQAQFELGNYRYDDELRARRMTLVDEPRGLILASGFIDHAGRLGEYELTDGTPVVSPVRRPHSFYFMELFKIEAGLIRQVEANFITVPYRMPSPWDRPWDSWTGALS